MPGVPFLPIGIAGVIVALITMRRLRRVSLLAGIGFACWTVTGLVTVLNPLIVTLLRALFGDIYRTPVMDAIASVPAIAGVILLIMAFRARLDAPARPAQPATWPPPMPASPAPGMPLPMPPYPPAGPPPVPPAVPPAGPVPPHADGSPEETR